MSNQQLDTFCHATTRYVFTSGSWHAIASPASWSADLANGTYDVTVVVGESKFHASSIKHSVQVEGVVVHDRVSTSNATPTVGATVQVAVSDGSLDVTFVGGTKTKIVSLAAVLASPHTPTPTTTSSTPSPSTTSPPTTAAPGVILEYAFEDGYGAFASDSAPTLFPIDLFLGYYNPTTSWTSTGLSVAAAANVVSPGPARAAAERLAETGRSTFELWVDPGPATPSPRVIAGLIEDGNSHQIVLSRDGNDLVWSIGSGTVTLRVPQVGGSVHHIGLVIRADLVEVWIDGSLVGSVDAGSNLLGAATRSRVAVGSNPDGSESWSGTIEHLVVHDGSLAQAVMASRSAAPPMYSCSGPSAAVRDGGFDNQGRSYIGVFMSDADLAAAVSDNRDHAVAARSEVIAHANAMLCQRPNSVTSNGGGNIWLTDSAYVVDGVFDLDADRHDYRAAERVSRGLVALGLAYRQTGDGRYAEHALTLIDAWALDNGSRWVPALSPNNREIEIYITQPGVIYGADLIWSYPGWTTSQRLAMKSWSAALGDAFTGDPTSNNIDSWRMVAIAAAGRFADRADLVTYSVDRYRSTISSRISPSGELTKELGRTRSLFYSVWAVAANVSLAEVVRLSGHDLYADQGSSGQTLLTALHQLAPHLSSPDPTANWPYEEIGPIYEADIMVGVYEMAFRHHPDSEFAAVITRWGRPMFARVITGHVTFSHGRSLSDAI